MNASANPTLDIRRPSPHVAEVWLNRPEVRNAFNDGVIAELTATFRTLGADAELRAIVLGGHGISTSRRRARSALPPHCGSGSFVGGVGTLAGGVPRPPARGRAGRGFGDDPMSAAAGQGARASQPVPLPARIARV